MGTRKELIEAAGNRYREAPKNDKSAILDEFAALSGYHRKHAIRLLNGTSREPTPTAPRDRVYGEAVRQLLVLVWEASDRLCGKRLKALMPALLDAMHRSSTASRTCRHPRTVIPAAPASQRGASALTLRVRADALRPA